MKRLLLALLLTAPVTIAAMLPLTVSATSSQTHLGDLTPFIIIVSDTIALADGGNLPAAEKRLTDYEAAWDAAEPKLYPLNTAEWGVIDDASDAALDAVRDAEPVSAIVKSTLAALLAALEHPAAN
jgi:hypothetical protein